MARTEIRLQDYAHSPVHCAVAVGDHSRLSRIVSALPRLSDPSLVRTESESLAQDRLADQISGVVDRRDVPSRETPLHLAVRLNDLQAVRMLAAAGADVSLQNASGWNALQEAICGRKSDLALVLLRHHHATAWAKWRRRLPRLVAVLRRMPDFYMEISFHFESSLLPFARRLAPSDTYKIWKRDACLRADTSLAGFDGLKIQRADQSFLFLGDGHHRLGLASGSLLVLNRTEKKIYDAFENAGAPLSPADEAGFAAQTSVYRPGMDVTRAELVGRTNWRRQERTESVGEWKAKVYELHNVVFSFRSRKALPQHLDPEDEEARAMELVFKENPEDGFLVAENPGFIEFEAPRRRNSSFERGDLMKEGKSWVSLERKSVDLPRAPSLSHRGLDGKRLGKKTTPEVACKESEYVKSLRPAVWLTEQFPLKVEELLPLLDILANKVKAVRRLRELLTTKFPPGTFPVKVAIPVVPTVRVVVTFNKFVNMDASEQFFTPMSSPRHLVEDHSSSSSSSSSSLRSKAGVSSSWEVSESESESESDPFTIPKDYTWSSIDDKAPKMRKSKSTKKGR
ncbi:hypothetical protein H6P81_006918 [Aristolochia fimbriata]|uniref:Ankyrin repeat domain-containing protein n=1 Tax=Aristolochia fimbriata TaxID=158543 RepID=A0AAV7F005_ARIFI|nr:hypothetical protein H6P81_006918 [Aristolochia fimbriata]